MRRLGIMPLTPQRIPQPEVRKLEPRVRKVPSPLAVLHNLLIRIRSPHPFARVLAEIGLLQAEKIVPRELALQPSHHLDRFHVPSLSPQKQSDYGSRLNVVGKASLRIVAQKLHALRLRT